MYKALFAFLVSIYGIENVALAYSDKVTEPGFSCIYYDGGVDTDKNLDGTTNMYIGNFLVQIWHDSLLQVLDESQKLIDKAEGTKFQIQSMTAVRTDGTKRKWHREISIQIMEDA